ncbi:hypothetical protein RB653_010159 [Dictyostelium firmibasis]|uniref:Uncharacterized protein n=1 Tax=Dictyostelium firmibasis TaxID=79012 RepID=A0AAN7TYV6_9MYCE
MTPYLKIIKSSYTLLSFFYLIANTIIRTIQNVPTSHKVILVSLYYLVFSLFITRIFYGSPQKIIQTYIHEKFESGNVSTISLFFTLFVSILLFTSFSTIGIS